MLTKKEFLKRLRELPEIASRMRSGSYIPGAHRSRVILGGHEFERTAPFVAGEHDLKQYAQRLSAKLGKPMRVIKKETKENLFVSLVDLRPSLSFGMKRTKREFAIEIAGALALSAVEADDRASVSALGLAREFTYRGGTRDKDALLFSLLALHAWHGNTTFAETIESIERASRLLPSYSSVFVISDWLFEPQPGERQKLAEQQAYKEASRALKALAVRHEVGVIALNDVRDFSIPEGSWRVRSCSGSSPMVVDGARAQAVLDRIRQERLEWFEGLTRSFGIDYCLIETDDTFKYFAKLLMFFAKRRTR